MSLVVCGTGSALPSVCLTNDDLAAKLDTSDDWITSRTGIKQRYICADDESAVTLGVRAATEAITRAELRAQDIDLIIVATATPNLTFPSVATQIQQQLDITAASAFDVQAACSGFIYGLSTAEGYLKLGKAKCALIIGVEVFSRIMDWSDRATAVLFGDGAGAVVLKKEDQASGRGLIGTEIGSDGRYADLLKTTGGIAGAAPTPGITMNGREVFKNATKTLSDIVTKILSAYNMDKSQVNWLVPHQANKRIIEATAKHLDLPMSRVVLTVAEHANTSAASIPLALHAGVLANTFNAGDILLLEAFGAGFTWGAALLEWS